MGRVEGKVALITGAARGQGRSHAIRLAGEGADIVAIDVNADSSSVGYQLGRKSELDETVSAVNALGRRAIGLVADVRDYAALQDAVRGAVEQFDRLDIVIANAGIVSYGAVGELPEQTWQDMIDINLTGVWHTVKATLPHIPDGGSIILTNSTAGLRGIAYCGHYAAAKHGVVGLMRTLVQEVSGRLIRVNCVHPGIVNTPMIHNSQTYHLFRPDLKEPTVEDFERAASPLNLMPIAAVEPEDVANAVLFLASDESRYVTGVNLTVDGGAALK